MNIFASDASSLVFVLGSLQELVDGVDVGAVRGTVWVLKPVEMSSVGGAEAEDAGARRLRQWPE